MELKTIDFSKKHFECQGRNFYVKDSLSFTRYKELQKINLEFGYSASFHEIYKNVKAAFDFLNQMKPAEGAIVLHNILYGIVSLDEKDDPALRICALFIDEEGEDVTSYDEGKTREKIECWGKECDVAPFFQLAANLVPQFLDAYKFVSLNGLRVAKNEESF